VADRKFRSQIGVLQRCVTPEGVNRYNPPLRLRTLSVALREEFMLDLTGILLSSIMMLIVIVRAVQLDSVQPWFQSIKREADPISASKRPWQRQK
jgi:hypothetical protein